MVGLVVAVGKNGEIGKGLSLLWSLPKDMQHFKMLTVGNTVVMGRRTWESLPNGALPNRLNIVISSRARADIPRLTDDVRVCASVEEVLKGDRRGDLFFIGGKAVYEVGLACADRLVITHVDASFPEADVFFPALNMAEWRVASCTAYDTDDRHQYSFKIVEYERI